ncbi:hypothetical protein J6590_087984 [Homalodisca vitripennis]|nr:hypothetical protein J6590_087984 [Homalodisca vitripennis]
MYTQFLSKRCTSLTENVEVSGEKNLINLCRSLRRMIAGVDVICFIPCGSRAADPLDGHRNVTGLWCGVGEFVLTSLDFQRGQFNSSERVSEVTAKKPSLTLNLGTNGLKVTSKPPPTAGCLQGQDTQRLAIQAAATLDIA